MLKSRFNQKDVGALFAFAVLATILVNLFMVFVAQIFGVPTDNYAFNIVFTAINTLAIGSVAFVYAAISKTNVITAIKLKAAPPLAHVGWGCLATVFLIATMLPLNMWISKLIVALGLPNPAVNLEMDVASLVIFAAILPSFCEEVVFRGAIAGALENNKNKLASLAIAGGLFSIFHMNPAQTVHQFVLGALLALMYYRSGSVWTTVILHLFNNIAVVVMSVVLGDNAINAFVEQNSVWLFFAGLICFAGCICGYLFTTKSSWQTNQDGETDGKYGRNCLILLLSAVAICAAVWITVLFVGVE